MKGNAEGAAFEGFFGEIGGDFAGNVGDEALVLFVKNIFLALRLHKVREGTADGVGDFAEVEAFFAMWAKNLDFGDGDGFVAEDIAPVVIGFLILGRAAEFFES